MAWQVNLPSVLHQSKGEMTSEHGQNASGISRRVPPPPRSHDAASMLLVLLLLLKLVIYSPFLKIEGALVTLISYWYVLRNSSLFG